MYTIMRTFTLIKERVPTETKWEVPPYKVGSNQLLFFYNGLLCIPGSDNQYEEIGKEGTISTEIHLHFALFKNSEVTFIIIPLPEDNGV